MKWASAISNEPSFDLAWAATRKQLEFQVDPSAVDLVTVFLSSHHAGRFHEIGRLLKDVFPRARVLGSSASGVLASGRELEEEPGLALLAGSLPGAELVPFSLAAGSIPDPEDDPAVWHRYAGIGDAPADFLLIPDPLTSEPDLLLRGFDRAWPGATIVGGLASGSRQPGLNALFLEGQVHTMGAVGLALRGDVVMDSVVAQGCRPIGPPLRVTRCERNLVYELNSRPVVAILEEIFGALDEEDQQLFQKSLCLGLAVGDGLDRGSFLIRDIMGLNPRTGVLACATVVPLAQVVQFHVRDQGEARRELVELLGAYRDAAGSPAAALMFTCLGRGTNLYPEPHVDSQILQKVVGPLPMAGFFGRGEIGPLHDRTWMHGYTSAIGLFRAR